MKLVVVYVLFALVHYKTFCQQTLIWDKKVKISWADFKGKVDKASPFAAASAVGIFYKFNSFTNKKGYKVKFVVYAGFDKIKSWSKKAERTAAILQHEQLHFDIAELVSRAFRKEATQRVYSRNYKSDINKIFNRYSGILQNLQRKYDAQTLHSNNKLKQEYWEKLVHREL